jgi:hypothetical protein
MSLRKPSHAEARSAPSSLTTSADRFSLQGMSDTGDESFLTVVVRSVPML